MKNLFVLLIIIIAGGGWIANKYMQKADTSNDEKNRFIDLTEEYNESAKLFVIEHAKQYHDDAFTASYRMWVLSPLSELDLASAYDEQAYYRNISDKIKQAAKKSKQDGAHKILRDIAKHYNVEIKNSQRSSKDPANTSSIEIQAKSESLLKSGKIGDKRTIPSSRKRYDDR